jgi:hypothetical protein
MQLDGGFCLNFSIAMALRKGKDMTGSLESRSDLPDTGVGVLVDQ